MNRANRIAGGLALGVITAINVLVILKYGARSGAPAAAAAVAYAGLFAAAAWGWPRYAAGWRGDGRTVAILSGGVALLSVAALVLVPAESLRVDRWSAMTAFNTALLHGDFPYSARTHLGNPLWGLPLAYVVGLPFQGLGDVGYLQPGVLLAFAFACFRLFGRRFDIVPALGVLAASPLYLWEVAVRSDLVSNALLVTLFLIWSEGWRERKTAGRMASLGVVLGLLACTRVVLLVPVLVYFVGYFRRGEARLAASLLLPAAASCAAVIAPFVAWSPGSFAENNPFGFQTVLSPVPLQVAVLAACVVAGRLARTFQERCLAGGLVLAAGVAAVFLLTAWSAGWDRALTGNAFDISYFDLAVPFLLVPLLFVQPVTAGAPNAEAQR